MAFGFKWTSSHVRKFMTDTRNLLRGKTKPSDQMGFKADNSRVMYHRHVHLRDERL
jgi:hypothetical protein